MHSHIFFPALIGFACLALAMERHQQDLLGRELPLRQVRALRVAGTLALLAALALAVHPVGWGLGLIRYSGHTGAAAGVVLLSMVVWLRREAAAKAREKAKGKEREKTDA